NPQARPPLRSSDLARAHQVLQRHPPQGAGADAQAPHEGRQVRVLKLLVRQPAAEDDREHDADDPDPRGDPEEPVRLIAETNAVVDVVTRVTGVRDHVLLVLWLSHSTTHRLT